MSVWCGDEDPCSVWSESLRSARKEHRCSACRETIRVGDRYHYTFYVNDGSPGRVKRCLRCEAIYRTLEAKFEDARARDDGDVEDGEMPDIRLDCGHTWQQRWREEPPEDVARLAFMSRDEIQAEGMRLPGLAER